MFYSQSSNGLLKIISPSLGEIWPKLFHRKRSFLGCRMLESAGDSVHFAAWRRSALNVR